MKIKNEDGPRGKRPARHHNVRRLAEEIGDAGRELLHILRRESRQERRAL